MRHDSELTQAYPSESFAHGDVIGSNKRYKDEPSGMLFLSSPAETDISSCAEFPDRSTQGGSCSGQKL